MRLTDCFIEFFAYVAYFKKSVSSKQPTFERIRADILRILSVSEEWVKKNRFSQEDFAMARFAVCAWVDESILSSSWTEKNKWQKEQLQRTIYHTANAGVEFFNRLNALGIDQRDVREVYYLCLAMGFMGRYSDAKDKYLLDQLKTSNLKVLMGSSAELPSLERIYLFPEAYPCDAEGAHFQKKKSWFTLFTMISFFGPVVLYIILFVVFSILLKVP